MSRPLNSEQWNALLRGVGFAEEVVRAIELVDRGAFLPEESRWGAYYPRRSPTLPLDAWTTPWDGSSKSPPISVHAQALDLLEVQPGDRCVEVGCGAGYTLALLHAIAGADVMGIEAMPELAAMAREHLADAGLDVPVICGDGIAEVLAAGPWDRLLLSCGATRPVAALLGESLAPGGRAVLPVSSGPGHRTRTRWRIVDRLDNGTVIETAGPMTNVIDANGRAISGRFVPLLGPHGHHIDGARQPGHVATAPQHRST